MLDFENLVLKESFKNHLYIFIYGHSGYVLYFISGCISSRILGPYGYRKKYFQGF